MSDKDFISNFIKLGIITWLRFICDAIKIINFKIVLNNKLFGKIDELFLEATNLIYKNLYINKVIIKTNNFNLKFNYQNHLIYSKDIFINCTLIIESINLENMIFKREWESIRNKIQEEFLEGNDLSSLLINNNSINLIYQKNNSNVKSCIALRLKDDFLFLEDIKNKKKILLPLDKNITINNCQIKNDLIKIDLFSKVTFEN